MLAAGVRALLPVVISASAPESTRQVAAKLAGYLGRISGAAFQVEAGIDGRRWRLHDALLGRSWSNQLPKLMAASPQALLFPLALVERDGLPR